MNTAPYGAWKSPITTDLILAKTVSPGKVMLDGQMVYWSEMRPEERGRSVIVRLGAGGQPEELLPAPFNARTRVHEYGGGDYLPHGGVLFFANFADQYLYRIDPGGEPAAIAAVDGLRWADLEMDERRGRLICVREDHRVGEQDAENTITALDASGKDRETGGTVLARGADFFSTPRISPDGARLAWLSWNHPNMPWDGTELWLAEFAPDGTLVRPVKVAGGEEESIFQPAWSPDGTLYFVSDRTGWWNLYRWNNGQAEPLLPMEAEFGQPGWNFGYSTYGFASPERLVCYYGQNGQHFLAEIDTRSLAFNPIESPYSDFDSLHVTPDAAYFAAASPTEPRCIARLDLTSYQTSVLKRSSETVIDPGYISIPQQVAFPTENGLTAYGIYYPPQNKDYSAPEGERPPLLVLSHGGPTGSAPMVFSPGILFWTSRGFAVLNVNYGGSTGYGRAYRDRLKGTWGVVDVDDCVNGALYLARQRLVDRQRMAIRGGSAGGYTTLSALTFRDVFRAGASHYGVSDVEALALDTHKFEARYLDRLIGPYPQAKALYIERSPIHHTERINSALILFQGAEDKVVPPEQSRKMYEAAKAKGLPVAYIEFEGEQHGFRQAQNIKRSLEAELYFYGRVFGFQPSGEIEPVQIENL